MYYYYPQSNEILWNLKLNAQGLKIFMIVVHTTTMID